METTVRFTAHSKNSMIAEDFKLAQERATAGQLALELMHEIKNPLEAVGHLVHLTDEDAAEPEAVRHNMALVREQLAHIQQIAADTLGFARSSPTPKRINLVTLAEAALRIHRRTIESKKIRLVKNLPEELPAEVLTSEMLQVISNLVVNALDALPEDGTLHLRMRRCDGKVHLTIADNGCGIPSEHADTIFEPYFTTKPEGNGLGLALSKEIVDRHQGSIRMRTSVTQGRSGTAFRICIPA
jgi:signal transduction histidine kinase